MQCCPPVGQHRPTLLPRALNAADTLYRLWLTARYLRRLRYAVFVARLLIALD